MVEVVVCDATMQRCIGSLHFSFMAVPAESIYDARVLNEASFKPWPGFWKHDPFYVYLCRPEACLWISCWVWKGGIGRILGGVEIKSDIICSNWFCSLWLSSSFLLVVSKLQQCWIVEWDFLCKILNLAFLTKTSSTIMHPVYGIFEENNTWVLSANFLILPWQFSYNNLAVGT